MLDNYLEQTTSADNIFTGIIFGGDSERFAHFSVKNLIDIGLMGEKYNRKIK